MWEISGWQMLLKKFMLSIICQNMLGLITAFLALCLSLTTYVRWDTTSIWNTLLSSWNLQSRNIDYNVTFNGFEMYLLINLFDSTTRVKDRDELLLNF